MKLNLGCGSKILDGYTNVDKFDYYKPDIVHDLEITPYPFEESSIDEILLSHVLEHVGQNPNIFNNIIKELYRICKNKSVINIRVPHPRHDDFISDPTHVRPITIMGLQLYDKNDDVWVTVPSVENSIVLNVADMFQRWTNDLLKSTPHRVVNVDMDRPRYSMPYFVDPGRDVMIKNLTSQPDKYPPISAYEYLKWRLAQSYVDNDYVENEEVKKDGKQYLPEEQLYASY